MALEIPEGLRVRRNLAAEAELVSKAREWIESESRSPGIHASDIPDPRLAFFLHTQPTQLPDRLVNTFLVGKVLHAFVIASYAGETPDITITDEGSRESEELGLTFSPDVIKNGIVRELKTSRKFYAAQEGTPIEDLDNYLEQLLVYMGATGTLESQLWVLYLNQRDEEGRTSPAFRAFDVRITAEDLQATKERIKATSALLVSAIERGDPSDLPLCREWKCGRRNCQYYDVCKPPGRFGFPSFDRVQAAPKVRGAKKAKS
jgi:hypothetical protein